MIEPCQNHDKANEVIYDLRRVRIPQFSHHNSNEMYHRLDDIDRKTLFKSTDDSNQDISMDLSDSSRESFRESERSPIAVTRSVSAQQDNHHVVTSAFTIDNILARKEKRVQENVIVDEDNVQEDIIRDPHFVRPIPAVPTPHPGNCFVFFS